MIYYAINFDTEEIKKFHTIYDLNQYLRIYDNVEVIYGYGITRGTND